MNEKDQEAVKASEKATEQEDQEEKAKEAPPASKLIIEFVEPGHASFKDLVADGFVTPDQIASAGLQLINQAVGIWNVSFVEMIVCKTVEEFFRQQKEMIQEQEVRNLLQVHGRGPN